MMEANDDSGVSVQTAKQDEADSSIVASSSPVVFQCTQCNSIVGDSTAWVTSNKVMRTITLGRVTSKVGVNPNIQVSESGVDKGSTFSTIFCMSCKEILGKQYMASPPDLDYIRGRFTFHVEKLNSYLIGSAQKLGNFDAADMLNIPSPDYLMARMNKMQFLIVSMNERIKNLEACLSTREYAPKLSDDLTKQSTLQVETESVSSTDHFSTRPRLDSFHSTGTEETITHQAEDGFLNREESIFEWQTNRENLEYDQAIGHNTREIVRKSSTAPEQRSGHLCEIQGTGIFQQLSSRMERNENFSGPDDNSDIGNKNNIEETGNMLRNNNSRRISSNGRKEQIDKERRNARNDAQGQLIEIQRSGWKNTKTPERHCILNESSALSENGSRSVPRKQTVIDTWASPGMERSGRESKKRKL